MAFLIGFDVTADVLGDDGKLMVTKRVHAKLLRKVRKAVLLKHWRERMPGHFTRSAFGKYPEYKRREVKYERMKAKVYGTSRPNVKTGQTREVILKTAPKITATQKQATMRFRLPFKGGTGSFRSGGTFKQIRVPGKT